MPTDVSDERDAGGDAPSAGGAAHGVLYVASTFGHLRSFHVPYIRAMVEHGDRVTLVAAGDPANLADLVGAGGVEGATGSAADDAAERRRGSLRVVRVPFVKKMSSPSNFAAARAIARMLRTGDYDLMLTHTALAAFFARLGVGWSGRRDLRVVNTVHGYLFGEEGGGMKSALLLQAERMTAGVTDEIVTMNAEDARIATGRRLCRGPVVQVDGMGVPEAAHPHAPTADERARARERLGVPQGAFVLLCAAEFSARKNQRVLVEALPSLPDDVMLALPGTGALRQEVADLAHDLGVEGRVAMPGFCDDLASWRAAADVCVSASRSEGLPFHAMEAMAAGLPLVLSAVKGHVDLVEEGVNGLTFPPDDAAWLARAVMRLRADPAERLAMGRASLERAPRYSLERVMPRLMGIYEGE